MLRDSKPRYAKIRIPLNEKLGHKSRLVTKIMFLYGAVKEKGLPEAELEGIDSKGLIQCT